MIAKQRPMKTCYRGQSLVEVLLLGPIFGVFLFAAVLVGRYFYTYSIAEAVSYSNSVYYSSTGSLDAAIAPDVTSAQDSTRFWKQLLNFNLPSGSASEKITTPINPKFGTHCLSTYFAFSSTLFPKQDQEWSVLPGLSPANSSASSVSVAFRPIYGGANLDTTCMSAGWLTTDFGE